jgi:hypothetical protein
MENLVRFSSAVQSNTSLKIDICWSSLNIGFCNEILDFYRRVNVEIFGNRTEALAFCRHFYMGPFFGSETMTHEERCQAADQIQQGRLKFGDMYSGLFEEMSKFINQREFSPKAHARKVQRLKEMDRARRLSFQEAYGFEVGTES